MEAPRQARGESVWMMKVTDKQGQRERGAEEQTKWVVGVTQMQEAKIKSMLVRHMLEQS